MSDILYPQDAGELADLIETERSLVVKFTAPSWCAPCRQFAPHFEAASTRTDVTFVSVDIDDHDWAVVDYKVQGVPTVQFYENGQYVRDLRERTAPRLLSEINNA